MKAILVGLPAAALISAAQAASWSGSVKTESGAWYITRESSNISFQMDQKVDGRISPVLFRGRNLSPYHSYYEDIIFNEVWMKETTSQRPRQSRSGTLQ